jgi:hypothetical protein
MRAQATSRQAQYDAAGYTYDRYGFHDDRGLGWVEFAGIMLLIVGVLNLIGGIAAIGNSQFYVHDTHYIVGSLKTWGWIATILGALQMLAGVGVFAKNQLARWTGVLFAALNAIGHLMFISSYPFFSLAIFAIDILVIYGLVAHGSRLSDSVTD